MQLKDIAVVITGGGSGLGAATARAMAAKGAKVAVLDVRQEQADAVAKEIGGVAVVADVANEAQLDLAGRHAAGAEPAQRAEQSARRTAPRV
mgnify:CR=1 FL=1